MKPPCSPQGDWLRSLAVLAAFPPVMVLLHELAHYGAAAWLGFHPVLCYDQISIPPWEKVGKDAMALIVLAGPAAECVLAATGLAWLVKNRHKQDPGRSTMKWMATALSLAGLRWFKTAFDGVHSDEARLSQFLGLPYWTVPLLLLVPSFLTAAVLWRFHRTQQSLLPFAAGFAACVISGLVWITFIGPALLPHPVYTPPVR